MSSIFDLPERVQRLRQMFTYFRNAALLTGAEVRDAVETEAGATARQEWAGLLADLGECFSVAQSLTDAAVPPPPAAAAQPLKLPTRASTLH